MRDLKKINRKWIFISLIILGTLFTFTFLSLETNVLFKNDDFTKTITFTSEQGDAGIIKLERNDETPSALDWVSFEDGKQYKLFSDDYVREILYIDLPEEVDRGTYRFDYIVDYADGEDFKETISFIVI